MWPAIFVSACLVLIITGVVRTWRRSRSLDDLRRQASAHAVDFRMAVGVRVRRGRSVSWMRNGFGEVELAIRGEWVVIELTGFMREPGRGLGAEVILNARTTTMRRARVRFRLLVRRECLVLSGFEPWGLVEIAVVPKGPFELLTAALLRAGVEVRATVEP